MKHAFSMKNLLPDAEFVLNKLINYFTSGGHDNDE
jgi:hypothetical protein